MLGLCAITYVIPAGKYTFAFLRVKVLKSLLNNCKLLGLDNCIKMGGLTIMDHMNFTRFI